MTNEEFETAHMAKILVIDDDAQDRGLIGAVLEERGYEVILAENGRTGLMLCHRQHPDAVVLDLRMPEMDGRSVLQQLRTLHPSLPVVVFSGHGTEEVEQEVLDQRRHGLYPKGIFAGSIRVGIAGGSAASQ